MTWEIVSGIIALCVASVTIGGVAVRLAMVVSRLDTTVKALHDTVVDLRVSNGREHDEIFCKIENHEGRISKIEYKEGIK